MALSDFSQEHRGDLRRIDALLLEIGADLMREYPQMREEIEPIIERIKEKQVSTATK
ncbi:MAG TPA: hypothetical protein PKM88_09490 [bacterium]|mgnify:CR=1 FL=1|nr:hypothetical protein [bacterium]